MLEVLSPDGRPASLARRGEVHSGSMMLHRAVHVLVLDGRGRILLQRRSASKRIQPLKWDSSVGGHVAPGESPLDAALREAREELGLSLRPEELTLAYEYHWRSEVEAELVTTYVVRRDGPFSPDPSEVEELRFWEPREIASALGSGALTPNFEHEYARLTEWLGAKPRRAERPRR
jgi:isopentenyldiphosphate isomerase